MTLRQNLIGQGSLADFGRSYERPRHGDVDSGIYIRIKYPVAPAMKRQPFSLATYPAFVARLAGVSWINSDNRDSGNDRFVFNELTQLVKRPRLMAISVSLSSSRPGSDSAQILDSDTTIARTGRVHYSLANSVIDRPLVQTFLPRQPFQKPSSSLCAFQLKRPPHFRVVCSQSVHLLRVVHCSIGIYRHSPPPKVHTNKRGFVAWGITGSGYINYKTVRSVAIGFKYCRPGMFTSKDVFLPVADIEPNSLSAIETRKRDRPIRFAKREHAAIVIDRCWAKRRKPPTTTLETAAHSRNATDYEVSPKPKSAAEIVVAFALNRELVGSLRCTTHISNSITYGRARDNGRLDVETLRRIQCKPASDGASYFHECP